MTKLVWDPKPRSYQSGLDRGVFYPAVGPGEVWDGLIRVEELPAGTNNETKYYDGVKIRRRNGRESFDGTIEAMTYPSSFPEDALTGRRPKPFGMSYRTRSGDRYRIHLVYNVLVAPSHASYSQMVVNPFKWGFSTLPVVLPNGYYTAHLIIDSGVAYPWTVEALEAILYGDEDNAARLPLPEELVTVIDSNAILQIIDNGDGTWTATGPDDVITMLDSTTFQIDWPSAVYINADSYTIYTL